jgi:hypothetical protein
MSWLTVEAGSGNAVEVVITSPPDISPPPSPTPPLTPTLAPASELLWCLTHRARPVTNHTVITTAPGDFGVPAVPVRPLLLRFWQRGDARDFCAAFVQETLKRADGDPRCRLVGICDIVHPRGEFRRCGPYLWARLRGDDWILIEVDLWPQLRASSCRPLDLIDCLGVVSMVDGLSAQAAQALGPNVYVGICRCDAW